MGTEIIADKFALLKTRGSNGVAFTHIVEDMLLGHRAVVKTSDKLGLLGLDYLKTMNLVREIKIPGILIPSEGGILEDESGYYMAFPELGEPSLENYLRMGAPLGCGEAVDIIEDILHILVNLHSAGYYHLFVDTRNIFYRPRVGVTLKDPALKAEFFHPLLELISAPDFSYFSPGVMDGGSLGTGADMYALGKLAMRLLEEADDTGSSPAEGILRWLATRCQESGWGEEDSSAAHLRDELEDIKARPGAYSSPESAPEGLAGTKGKDEDESGGPSITSVSRRARRYGKGPRMRMAVALVVLSLLICGLALAIVFRDEEVRAPAAGRTGGFRAGVEAMSTAVAENEKEDSVQFPASDAGVMETREVESAEGDEAPAAKPAVGENEGTYEQYPTVEAPLTGASPAAPVASFTVLPLEGQSPLQVYLDASSSYDPDGSIVSYAWSCGGQGRTIYHVFESNVIPTTIAITLTVTDDGGNSSSATRYVTLY